MKTILKLNASNQKVHPFRLEDFVQDKESNKSMKKITKKELKMLADELGLSHKDSDIIFTKKILSAYVKRWYT